MFAATFDARSGWFGPRTKVTVSVPWPKRDLRHVSDLKVVSGRVLITSATDPGASGPFRSAAYDVGGLGWSGAKPVVAVGTPVELARWTGHKVEGLACAGATGLVGSDDEKAGGSVLAVDLCGSPGGASR